MEFFIKSQLAWGVYHAIAKAAGEILIGFSLPRRKCRYYKLEFTQWQEHIQDIFKCGFQLVRIWIFY